ncbi:bifunctional proline dehydrogenase/L-glutamate gamma-semialdehyde dehydrogenase PutA [Pseudorhodobacter sp.]|uniref:bifunctional proline dehydrogenase/L-glutamate gamma-semialdehyde dehydrogenase PutA n=1 Tax=Pseudorhodobacter sp. TaxID=1934400 RepID=UPI0026473DDC|nr:bifunctional proline dehydrogenase/L-glutamate gamma-semialdehyde dehydrogenase PutA [Pseudorhodobacter sp.]MDN5786411.1 bifunctional proline dehydrogenase/L-glutamate gamma-semialdehyde dehydrogenase PutA [Pseudorhodobacter sp.]
MPRDSIDTSWTIIDRQSLRDEARLIHDLITQAGLSDADRARIAASGADLVRAIRASAKPGLMEVFLAEYGLSTDEGIALMCLAEALLRVPDADTMDALIEDKIAPSNWGKHLGRSASSLVNASTWALMLTGRVLDDRQPGIASSLRGAVKRLGEPVIRTAVSRAMKEMGKQFVLGETIEAAMKRAQELEGKGFTYSYDMLGEAARTEHDARRYHLSYTAAITAIAKAAKSKDIRDNPGISVKLSALHPRYEVAKRERVMEELVPRVRALAGLAKAAGLGFNIDAEEADRLALSLQVIEAVLSDNSLKGWEGFGVVVQAYGRRAGAVIDWLYGTAERLDRKIMVRLVKGAYWDAEVKRAQVMGLASFPVFTRKQSTDVSYMANAKKLLGMTDRIYPQFATHNAHTVAAVLDMATDKRAFEFQRLHGMGERLHDIVHEQEGTRCRIYAPVGAHRDLLAYLVRRLLENGANSSFVNQIVDESVPAEEVAGCPIAAVQALSAIANPILATGPALFGKRRNSEGWDLTDSADLARIEAARAPFEKQLFEARPMLAGPVAGGQRWEVKNPATGDVVGHVLPATGPDVETALSAAKPWDAASAERAAVLRRAADLYEENFGTIFALLAREAGKTLLDAVGELREAVDFLRYYADQGEVLTAPARGVFTCISPWNFPLAIFSGQIAAALVAGNAVLAKPAEQTGLIAALAVDLLHKAGVPKTALQLLPGEGAVVGAALTGDARVNGVCFTGSTATALRIRATMAEHMEPTAPLIAETGGLNAMVVDSTALPEQAVRDILASSFQSAGQRCSALRCLYLQDDVSDTVKEMLFGAMDDLEAGNPWELVTDVGPVIDAKAQAGIREYIEAARAEGRVLKEGTVPKGGTFIPPTVIQINGIADMPREIFGPVLHIAPWRSGGLNKVIADVNAMGYGLTFGLHSRIDDRVERVVSQIEVGNTYVNRNQIGAVVGSQPFGGEGLSGTGPKAGGPEYLARFTRHDAPIQGEGKAGSSDAPSVQKALTKAAPARAAIDVKDLPGPTGESNRLSAYPRLPLLCLGPSEAQAAAQADAVRALGGVAVAAAGLSPAALTRLDGFSAALWWGDATQGRAYAKALASRKSAILPLIGGMPDAAHVQLERHVCIDTTASGGNAQLLAEVGEA